MKKYGVMIHGAYYLIEADEARLQENGILVFMNVSGEGVSTYVRSWDMFGELTDEGLMEKQASSGHNLGQTLQ